VLGDNDPQKPAQLIDLAAWLRGAAYVLLASFAGALGHIFARMDAGKPVRLWETVVQALGAGLVGLFAMWMCQASNWSQPMTAVTVGVSGWLGASASIQMLQRFIWGRLGLNRNPDDDPSK